MEKKLNPLQQAMLRKAEKERVNAVMSGTETALAKAEVHETVRSESSDAGNAVAASKPDSGNPSAKSLLLSKMARQVPSQASIEATGTRSLVVAPTTPVPKANPLLAAAKAGVQKAEARDADYSFLFKEGPKDFQSLLNGFDQSLNRDTGIDDFNVDHLRQYVRNIMVELQTQPELEGLMISRDVRNIIIFIRSQRERALELGEKKAVKAATSKARKPGKAKFDPFGGAGANLSFGDIPASVADLGEWDM